MVYSHKLRCGAVAAVFGYAGVSGQIQAAPTTFRDMRLEDFFLDRAEMLGQQVRLKGEFRSAGDIVFLVYDGGKAATFVSIKRASREQRKAVLERCSTGCTGLVVGKVARVGGDIGLDADSIDLDP